MRKSARMLRVGMLITIDGRRRVITGIIRDDEDRMVTIVCGEHTYRRSYGTKFDVSHGC